ncbi:MAG: bifunctional diaminohydroxyphosphoribosylaminopyrimidine deaminase/5-amino-6-(5-phosphoribosylamino)uracil reductase RibD [Burkholderiales bacterium]|nr:bifunctional diaminohydroxyphosphoribosylaminopyrimidine deaminase/5-amino-6-(5-phosphoribosylamino)uracil reductase RibD [Burkholderiales bacterium]
MAEALRLAEKGLYTATPNPRVGCVIVRDGEVVGTGWHEKTGGPHAEIVALRAAGERARGATAYVTLEPCSHHGRTPPCIDALIEAGITRLVAAMQDPNPKVAGSGFDRLRAAGIAVESGLMQDEAQALNVGFVSRMRRGRPWVRMKIAASLDGRTALANGRSQWITGPEARRDGHAWRARACAVLTGIGTVRDDDPQLNVREVQTPRQPLKVLVDSRLQLPLSAKLLEGGRVLVAAAVEDKAGIAALQDRGAEVLLLPNASGKVELTELMRELARRELNEVHVEAGFKLNGSLLSAGLVDELLIYLAPSILGHGARGMFDLPELEDLAQKRLVQFGQVQTIGSDLRVLARVLNAI